MVAGLVKEAEEEPWKGFLLLSFALIPRGPINYICVILKCPTKIFWVTLVTGCWITDGAAIYVAYTAVQLARSSGGEQQQSPMELTLQVVGITTTMALFAVLGYKARKVLAQTASKTGMNSQEVAMVHGGDGV